MKISKINARALASAFQPIQPIVGRGSGRAGRTDGPDKAGQSKPAPDSGVGSFIQPLKPNAGSLTTANRLPASREMMVASVFDKLPQELRDRLGDRAKPSLSSAFDLLAAFDHPRTGGVDRAAGV